MDAIRATLDAAYIQGVLGFLGALIGALALIISIKIAAKNTIKEIKLEKVAESKRDQYIALTEAYTQYIVSTLIISSKSTETDASNNSSFSNSWENHVGKYIELIGCINKVNLITTSEIRLELFKLQKKISSYQTSVANYHFNGHPKDLSDDLEESVFEFGKLLRSDLGIESDFEIEEKIIKFNREWPSH